MRLDAVKVRLGAVRCCKSEVRCGSMRLDAVKVRLDEVRCCESEVR